MAKKILIVDDDRLVATSLATLLKAEGYIVNSAESGREAFDLINQDEFDLIISDIRMPEINGIEMMNYINNDLKTKNKKAIPVVFITGYSDETSFNAAKKMGAADFLYKPFDKELFLNSIAIALEA